MTIGCRGLAAGLMAVATIIAMIGSSAAQTMPYGRWLAEDINGGGVIDRLQTTLDISAKGRATGFGGCNAFTGQVRLDGAGVAFGPLASTRKACTRAVMDQEYKFHQALNGARSWRIDEHGKLVLTDASGNVVARLTRALAVSGPRR